MGLDAFPRLDPPPPVTKKRTPRALKTPQDMLIAPQLEGTSPRSSTEETPEPPVAHPDPSEEQPVMRDPSSPECPGVPSMMGTPGPSGDQPTGAFPVPDLIHKGSLESQWRVGERATETSPHTEKPSRRPGLQHELTGSTGRPEPHTAGWEVEGLILTYCPLNSSRGAATGAPWGLALPNMFLTATCHFWGHYFGDGGAPGWQKLLLA